MLQVLGPLHGQRRRFCLCFWSAPTEGGLRPPPLRCEAQAGWEPGCSAWHHPLQCRQLLDRCPAPPSRPPQAFPALGGGQHPPGPPVPATGPGPARAQTQRGRAGRRGTRCELSQSPGLGAGSGCSTPWHPQAENSRSPRPEQICKAVGRAGAPPPGADPQVSPALPGPLVLLSAWPRVRQDTDWSALPGTPEAAICLKHKSLSKT